jgi:hypothetical protein
MLQVVALGLPVVAVALQLGGAMKANAMLSMALAALCLFYLGRLIEGYSAR